MAGGQRFWYWGQVSAELDFISPHDLSKFLQLLSSMTSSKYGKVYPLVEENNCVTWPEHSLFHNKSQSLLCSGAPIMYLYIPYHMWFPLTIPRWNANSLWYPWNTKEGEKFQGAWTNWTLYHLIHIWTFKFIFQYFNWQLIPCYGLNKYWMLKCHWYTRPT